MNTQEIKNEAFENIVAVAIIAVCLIAGWLYYDSCKREAEHHDTDIILDGIDKRVEDAGKRIDSAKQSVDKAEKAVTEAVGRIERSEKSAGEIATGIGECENRLDGIIQRQGRITNLVTEIERINK